MLFKFLTKLLLSIKLLRIKKTAAQDRQLAIKLAATNNIDTVYDVGSAGTVSEETIRRYIQECQDI